MAHSHKHSHKHLQYDPEEREGLIRVNDTGDGDGDGEQTWPSEQELLDVQKLIKGKRRRRKLPAGGSSVKEGYLFKLVKLVGFCLTSPCC